MTAGFEEGRKLREAPEEVGATGRSWGRTERPLPTETMTWPSLSSTVHTALHRSPEVKEEVIQFMMFSLRQECLGAQEGKYIISNYITICGDKTSSCLLCDLAPGQMC